MDVFTCAAELLRHRRPERPVLALRPHAARRAAHWFLTNFPGRVLYAAKANDAPEIVAALVKAGIRAFDVASLIEIERLAPVPGAELYFMNPIKSRESIVRAYRDFGVRSFAFDRDEELEQDRRRKPAGPRTSTFPAPGLSQHAQSHSAGRKIRRVERRRSGASLRARQIARRLGITFHVGSQAVVPAAFGEAIQPVGQLILDFGVMSMPSTSAAVSPAATRIPIRRGSQASWTRSSAPPTSSRSSIPASFSASRGVRSWRKPSR